MSASDTLYIYDLPYTDLKKLSDLLNQDDTWKELAGDQMQYDVVTINTLCKEKSPSEELLMMWGHDNHTVLELFVLLWKMHHYEAMLTLKGFIHSEYHKFIPVNSDNNNESSGIKVNLNKTGQAVNSKKSPHVKNVQLAISAISMEDNAQITDNVPEQQPALSSSPKILNNGNARPAISKDSTSSSISSAAESARFVPQILYENLRQATKNWDPSLILGRGGFGTVFKGDWKCTQVAIKRIEQKREGDPESHNEQMKQSITELYCLNAYRHDNILPLYGYSLDGPQPCLVYQYMLGGSLDGRLRNRDPSKLLPWSKRLDVAIGTARGLQFLHTIFDKPLIHGDIKPANILLDLNDIPKIGDFGLAREGPQTNYSHIVVSRVHGTKPYLPYELLLKRKVSIKVDTYSFGVVLFEIATGLSAYDRNRNYRYLKDHVSNYEKDVVELKDTALTGGEICFRCLIDIGKLCVKFNADERPDMVMVLLMLEDIIAKMSKKGV